METIALLIDYLTGYLKGLDWNYILTFILFMHGLNNYRVLQGISRITRIKIKTRYRVLIVGAMYGGMVYFIRGYSLSQAETLFQSFVFAVVFHKMIAGGVLDYLEEKFFPTQLKAVHIKKDETQKEGKPENDGSAE